MLVSLELIVIVALILLNGLLAMSEMAVVSSKKARLKKLVDDGNKGAKAALELAESDNDFLASIQVGITLIGVLAGAFSGATLSDKISHALSGFNPDLAPYADAIGLVVVVAFVTYFSLVLGELVPKRLALNNPENIASRLARLISFLGILLRPIVYILSISTTFVLKLLGANQARNKTVTEEEVKILIEEGAQAGIFDKQEETMMKRVLRLDDCDVADLMTPRTKVIAIDINEGLEQTLNKIAQNSHTAFPVFDKMLDRPIGLLSAKTLLAKFIKNEPIELGECLTTPLFFPKSLAADDALERFRESGKQIAFIVDEYGGFAGVITVYDITQSIVGEMPKSNKNADRKIVQRDDGSLLVEGYTPLQDFLDYLNLELSDSDDIQTVGGLMMAKLGKIPAEGESIKLGEYKFEVVDMDRHRVDKILVFPEPAFC